MNRLCDDITIVLRESGKPMTRQEVAKVLFYRRAPDSYDKLLGTVSTTLAKRSKDSVRTRATWYKIGWNCYQIK